MFVLIKASIAVVMFVTLGMHEPVGAVEFEAGSARDPFASFIDREGDRRPVRPSVRKIYKGYVLEGLVWNSSQPQAIINGTVVRVGDTIGSAKVLDISKNGVKLQDAEREFSLGID